MGCDYSVLIIDMARYDDEENYVIKGFRTQELAQEFARRWVRSSLEEFRQPDQSPGGLRSQWFSFGEDASVIGDEPHYAGSLELDHFIANPATAEEQDWAAIKQQAGVE